MAQGPKDTLIWYTLRPKAGIARYVVGIMKELV